MAVRFMVCAAAVLLSVDASGQKPEGRIAGMVTDPLSGRLSGASVELLQGSRKFSTKTNNVGLYSFEGLSPGEYALELYTTGFATTSVRGIRLGIGENKQLPGISLLVGTVGCIPPRPTLFLSTHPDRGDIRGRITFSRYEDNSPSPLVGRGVSVIQEPGAVLTTNTNSQGEFSFEALVPGRYLIRTDTQPQIIHFVMAGWDAVYELSGPPATCPEKGLRRYAPAAPSHGPDLRVILGSR